MNRLWRLYDRIVYWRYNQEYRNYRAIERIRVENYKKISEINIVGMTLFNATVKIYPLEIRIIQIDNIVTSLEPSNCCERVNVVVKNNIITEYIGIF
jgi:hypothetical protein